MYQSCQLGRFLLEGFLDIFDSKYVAPWAFQAPHLGTIAGGHVTQAFAKVAVHSDQYRIARLDEIAQGSFHPCDPRPRDRDRQPVVCLKHESQQILHPTHQYDKSGVKMTCQRMGYST